MLNVFTNYFKGKKLNANEVVVYNNDKTKAKLLDNHLKELNKNSQKELVQFSLEKDLPSVIVSSWGKFGAWTKCLQVGSNLTPNMIQGTVTIGDGIKKVKVSAQMGIKPLANGVFAGLMILKNGVGVTTGANNYLTNNAQMSVVINEFVLEVAKGDVIRIDLQTSANTFLYANRSNFIIEKVE